MSDRDDLAELIEKAQIAAQHLNSARIMNCNPQLPDWDKEAWMREFPYTDERKFVAEAVLAAGWTRPKTVTTVEELEALPDQTVIRCAAVGPKCSRSTKGNGRRRE